MVWHSKLFVNQREPLDLSASAVYYPLGNPCTNAINLRSRLWEIQNCPILIHLSFAHQATRSSVRPRNMFRGRIGSVPTENMAPAVAWRPHRVITRSKKGANSWICALHALYFNTKGFSVCIHPKYAKQQIDQF